MIAKLPTDFENEQVSNRRYMMEDVGNNEKLVADVSDPEKVGSRHIASDVNDTNSTVNKLIGIAETDATTIANWMSGKTIVPNAVMADSVGSTPKADRAEKAHRATRVNRAEKATYLNNERMSVANMTFNFVNNRYELYFLGITADSIADVYFAKECMDIAMRAVITVETFTDKVVLTCGRKPSGTLKGTIRIRVI